MSDILLVFAMEEESQNAFGEYNLLHTGIGKINASYGLTQYLARQTPDLVVNLGTAGSRKHAGGIIVNQTSFIQRDMDVMVLGFEKHQTPFSKDPIELCYGQKIDGLAHGVCGTGDSFDSSEEALMFDVVDMEAYALALICQREEIPFLCLKYISDGADGNASQDWNKALSDAAGKLKKTLKDINL